MHKFFEDGIANRIAWSQHLLMVEEGVALARTAFRKGGAKELLMLLRDDIGKVIDTHWVKRQHDPIDGVKYGRCRYCGLAQNYWDRWECDKV